MIKRLQNPSERFVNCCTTIITVELVLLFFYGCLHLAGVFDISHEPKKAEPPPRPAVEEEVVHISATTYAVLPDDYVEVPTDTGETIELTGRELYEEYIHEICEIEYPDISPELVIAMVETESAFQPKAKNGYAIGLMQVDPRWQKERCKELGVYDISEPYANLCVGIDFLHDLLKQTNWNTEKALMIYNMGPKVAYKYYSQGIISKYAKTIIARSRELRSED